jgi:hypothetical protein
MFGTATRKSQAADQDQEISSHEKHDPDRISPHIWGNLVYEFHIK